jgi:hypothetical protein
MTKSLIIVTKASTSRGKERLPRQLIGGTLAYNSSNSPEKSSKHWSEQQSGCVDNKYEHMSYSTRESTITACKALWWKLVVA